MAKSPNRISGITVRGFKSICAEQHLDIRPLTILAGVNSSGKSSFMQPLLLLKQTLESPGDPGALLLYGPNVRFTLADQLLSHAPGKESSSEFTVRIDLANGQSLELVFLRETGKGFELRQMLYKSQKDSFVVRPGMSHEEIVKLLPKPFRAINIQVGKGKTGSYRWVARRDRCFLGFGLVSADTSRAQERFVPFDVSPSQMFVPHIQKVIHVPGLRGNPERNYHKMAGGPQFQGTFEPYVASVIAQWEGNGRRVELKQLSKALEDMGLTWKVAARAVDDTQIELKVARLPHARRGGAGDLVSIADVGYGVSQSLPVVVALLAARPGQLVYLEQPEIHLHPWAQRRFADILKDAVDRGVVAVVETHSALLLREVQTLVAKEELRKEDVALHWFRRDEQGETTVKTAELDDAGTYGDWPEDFDETELQAEKEYLDAVEHRGSIR